MAPPFAPPPYSAEDIKHITDPDEQRRAMAELSSYIAHVKKMQAEGLVYEEDTSNDHVGHDSSAPASPYRNNPGGTDGYPGSRSYRGGHSRGRGGYAGYHPYQRSSALYRNKSVVFNQAGSSNETSPVKKAGAHTPNGAPSDDDREQHNEPQKLCPAFTSTGVCARHVCHRVHDPEKQAVCKSWLFKGSCPKGDACALSHDANPHNAPTCQHFQEARCNNENCRFSHVRISPTALNCEEFGVMGYCEKGADCFELHAHECPHFSNTGSCFYGDHCRLNHVRRASRLRKAARQPSEGLSSLSNNSKEDIDDTAAAETWVGPDANDAARDPHQFTQQADFVALDADD